MVEDIFNMYSPITAELKLQKEVKFFAVVKMDDLTERWSLLFGLVGVKDLDKRHKIFEKIKEVILNNLSKENTQNIARIGLFSTTDHLISGLKKFDEGEKIENIKANGNYIHEGYVLISNTTAKKIVK